MAVQHLLSLPAVETVVLTLPKHLKDEAMQQSDGPPLACMQMLALHKCRYKEGDLNVGENSCVDRCASKYWQVTGIVGQLLGGRPMMVQPS